MLECDVCRSVIFCILAVCSVHRAVVCSFEKGGVN